MTRASHIRALCAEVGARLYDRLDDVEQSHCQITNGIRIICVPPVKDDHVYLVALHELGHAACGHTGKTLEDLFGTTPRTLRSEGEAWEWALDHAEFTPTPQAAERALFYLSTYLNSYMGGAIPEATLRAQSRLQELAHATPAPKPARPRRTNPAQLAFDFA